MFVCHEEDHEQIDEKTPGHCPAAEAAFSLHQASEPEVVFDKADEEDDREGYGEDEDPGLDLAALSGVGVRTIGCSDPGILFAWEEAVHHVVVVDVTIVCRALRFWPAYRGEVGCFDVESRVGLVRRRRIQYPFIVVADVTIHFIYPCHDMCFDAGFGAHDRGQH